MRNASIGLVIAVCVVAVTQFERDIDSRPAPVSIPGMVNVDPAVERKIHEASGKVEELMFLYHQKRSKSQSQNELDQAELFYDREVIPAQIVRLKMRSLKHSFKYQGIPTPSRINHVRREARATADRLKSLTIAPITMPPAV